MNKNLKIAIITTLVIIGVFFIYRILFIRTVNYNIGGVEIPARYNMLTGKAVPIADYKGKAINKTVTDRKSDRIGLESNDVTAAHFRWALFEEWANSRPQYKGWESNPETFKKANEDFKNTVHSDVKVVK